MTDRAYTQVTSGDLRNAVLAVLWGVQVPVLLWMVYDIPAAHNVLHWLENLALTAMTWLWFWTSISYARKIGKT